MQNKNRLQKLRELVELIIHRDIYLLASDIEGDITFQKLQNFKVAKALLSFVNTVEPRSVRTPA